jgi:hypothetical protein
MVAVLIYASRGATPVAPSTAATRPPLPLPVHSGAAADFSSWIHPGYGINVSIWDEQSQDWVEELNLDWIKLYNQPDSRPPFNVLLRLPANWANYDDLNGYCSYVQGQATIGLGRVEAYEIGNEPNLDWAWSEGAPGTETPNPAEYAVVLQTAYDCIKAVDPDAIVVSGGLATVGPYDETTDPPAYPNAWNDLKFLQAMYDHGARGHFDALGSHPYGFYFAPEQDPGGWADHPDRGSMFVNGLAFRRAEQQREVMVTNGDAQKQIWATEWGWLLREESCQSEWLAQGRWWQVVDQAIQADYTARAFDYAYDHWPWMGPMFLFNLDFSRSGWYTPCDAVRYYAVRNGDGTARQAYDAVRELSRWPYALVHPESVSLFLADEELAVYTRTVQITSTGAEPLTYTASADADWLGVPSGAHTGDGAIALTMDTRNFVTGTVTAPVTVTTNGGLNQVYRPVTVTVRVVDEAFHTYLPLTLKTFVR